MFDFIRKALSGSNEAEIKRLRKTVEQIGALEGQMQKLSDEEPLTYSYYHSTLKGKTPPKASSYQG